MEKVTQTHLAHLPSLFEPNLRNDRKCILSKSKAVLWKNAISASDILNISWKTANSLDWINGKHIWTLENICEWWELCQRSCCIHRERGCSGQGVAQNNSVIGLFWCPVMPASGGQMCVPRQEQREQTELSGAYWWHQRRTGELLAPCFQEMVLSLQITGGELGTWTSQQVGRPKRDELMPKNIF